MGGGNKQKKKPGATTLGRKAGAKVQPQAQNADSGNLRRGKETFQPHGLTAAQMSYTGKGCQACTAGTAQSFKSGGSRLQGDDGGFNAPLSVAVEECTEPAFVTTVSCMESMHSDDTSSFMTALSDDEGGTALLAMLGREGRPHRGDDPDGFAPNGSSLPSVHSRGSASPSPTLLNNEHKVRRDVYGSTASSLDSPNSERLTIRRTSDGKYLLDLLAELQSANIEDSVKAKNLHSLNEILRQRKNYMERCTYRQEILSRGLLNALNKLIDSNNSTVIGELSVFFASESNDNLLTGCDSRHPIEVFHAAYLKVKKSPAVKNLLDLLDVVARADPSVRRLKRAIDVLKRGHLRHIAVQTEDPPKEDLQITTTDLDSVRTDDISLLEVKRRPRSRSRLNLGRPKQLPSLGDMKTSDILSSSICESPPPSLTSPAVRLPPPPPPPPLPLGLLTPVRTLQQASTSAVASPIALRCVASPTAAVASPPPPPPLPPAASSLSLTPLTPSVAPTVPSTGGSVIVRSVPVYKKTRATNTIVWDTVKSEVVTANATVWSSQRGDYDAAFTEEQRDKLERVFERAPLASARAADQCMVERKRVVPATATGLTEKRALNLGIVLARFRPSTVEQLIEKLNSKGACDLNPDYLNSLLKHFPTNDELAVYRKLGSSEGLKDVELFCYLASIHPTVKIRVELCVLADTIGNDLARHNECARALLAASVCLHTDESVHLLLRRCLQYGNFLNQSSYAAGASGFALSSLLNTLCAKGRGASANTRLVDVLAESAEDKLRRVVDVIDVLQKARGASVEDVEKSECSLRQSIRTALRNLEETHDDELQNIYKPLMKESIAECDRLAKTLKRIRENEGRLKVFFCASNMSMESIIDVIFNAVTLVKGALTLAKERESRRQRQKGRLVAGSDARTPTRTRCGSRGGLDVRQLIALMGNMQRTL